ARQRKRDGGTLGGNGYRSVLQLLTRRQRTRDFKILAFNDQLGIAKGLKAFLRDIVAHVYIDDAVFAVIHIFALVNFLSFFVFDQGIDASVKPGAVNANIRYLLLYFPCKLAFSVVGFCMPLTVFF